MEREILSLQDIAGRGSEILFETNWNTLVKGNKYIKVSIDNKEVILSQRHLYSILFMIGEEELQDKAVDKFTTQLPVKTEYHRVGIKTTRDIKKGEEIMIPLSLTFNKETGKIKVNKGL